MCFSHDVRHTKLRRHFVQSKSPLTTSGAKSGSNSGVASFFISSSAVLVSVRDSDSGTITAFSDLTIIVGSPESSISFIGGWAVFTCEFKALLLAYEVSHKLQLMLTIFLIFPFLPDLKSKSLSLLKMIKQATLVKTKQDLQNSQTPEATQ